MTLDDIFGPTGQVTWVQECARAAVIFVYALVLVRFTGRRVFGQWSPPDIVVAVLTGSTLSRALTGNADLVGTLAATTLLFALHRMLLAVAARSPRFARLTLGVPVTLVSEGEAREDAMALRAVDRATLDAAARSAGLSGIEEASVIVMETSGRISARR